MLLFFFFFFYFQKISPMSEQVQVRFVTESQYKVNDAAMLLPSDIKKEGLSAIVNGLLDNGNRKRKKKKTRSNKN